MGRWLVGVAVEYRAPALGFLARRRLLSASPAAYLTVARAADRSPSQRANVAVRSQGTGLTRLRDGEHRPHSSLSLGSESTNRDPAKRALRVLGISAQLRLRYWAPRGAG